MLERLPNEKDASMKKSGNKRTDKHIVELEHLEVLSEDQIDIHDIP